MKTLKLKSILWIIVGLLIVTKLEIVEGQSLVRKDIKIPDILGYNALKCDFHIHTVFSDGRVWPTIRAEEAWIEGLDAFATTDHIEHARFEDDIITNLNRSYEIAQSTVDKKSLNLTVIRGGEITRSMPPGHMNAIFLNDVSALKTENWRDAVIAAHDQNAFMFLNHPCWRRQQADGVAKWYDEHTELFEKGLIHGIEVVNGDEYCPEAHEWCLEKNLTMLGNSDVHDPIMMDYHIVIDEHRPMTIVFTESNTEKAIKEALFSQRTAVYWENNLIGEEKYLRPIFDNSIQIEEHDITIKGSSRDYIKVFNSSGIDFELILNGQVDEISVPTNITLYAERTILFEIRGTSDVISGVKDIIIPYRVRNLLIRPGESLPVEINLNIIFVEDDK